MEALVQQRFGNIHRADVQRFRLVLERNDELVAGTAIRKRQFKPLVAQTRLQVIGVQRGKLRNPAHAVAAQ